MLDSLSFLHSSPPVFSSANTVNPSFLCVFLFRKAFRSCSNLNTHSTFLIFNLLMNPKMRTILHSFLGNRKHGLLPVFRQMAMFDFGLPKQLHHLQQLRDGLLLDQIPSGLGGNNLSCTTLTGCKDNGILCQARHIAMPVS